MVELDPWFFKNNTWSFSRHRIWNTCQRQYYYSYIAPYCKPPAPFDVDTIRRLKEFHSRFFLQGKVIHELLDEQIDLFCKKKAFDPSGTKNRYTRKITRYKMMASELLTEYRHGEPVSESFFKEIEESGVACLDLFFQTIWPEYRNCDCLRHEQGDYFSIGDIGVMVKVDFVSRRDDGLVVLTDWKTGMESENYETELQMAAYVLWGMEYYQKKPDEIKAEAVFLKTGKKRQYPFFEERLAEVREVIKRDYSAMNASYGIEDFPPRPIPRECISCRFATVCPVSVK